MKTGESATRKHSSIDWARVRRTLENAEAAIRLAGTPSPEEVREVLKARAREMARESIAAETAERIEVVEFLLAGEAYAIESRYVRAIHPLTSLAPLPCTPSFVLGIANVRGEILSVIDIGKFFELPGEGLTNLNKLIALDSGHMHFGILADAIVDVRHIPVAAIQSSLPTLTGIREEYLKGVTAGRTVVLDAEKLIADQKLVVREQVG